MKIVRKADVEGGCGATHLGAILLLILSALAFSTAGFFTREAPVGLWAMVFWRNVFGSAALLALSLRSRDVGHGALWPGVRGCAAIGCSAIGTICYIAAFAYTSVANISIIYATAPMLTGALAWIALKERPSRRTLAASTATLVGVAATVGGSLSAGSAFGDGLALLMTAALSGMTVLARGAPLPALQTALASALLAAVIAVPMALLGGSGLTIDVRDGLWLAAFGVVTMTIALPCYLAGAARVPAGRAMLISALEMPCAPLWVWLAFGEVPSPAALFGGLIIFLAIVSDLN